MKFKISKPFWQVMGLGVLAGMRTSSAPAIASHILSHRNSSHLAKSPLDFMQSNKVAMGFKILAAGELVTDKLPSTPNRTEPAGVVFRCISGSLAGACIYKASGNNALIGAAIGSLAALGSTFGSYLLRKNLVCKFNLSDPFIGATEDTIVIAAGLSLIKNSC